MRVLRDIVGRRRVDVGEVASAAARDENLATKFAGVIQQHDFQLAFAGFDGAHHSGTAGADDHYIERFHCLFRLDVSATTE